MVQLFALSPLIILISMLVFALIFIIAIVVIVIKVSSTVNKSIHQIKKVDQVVKDISQVAYGTSDIVEGFKRSQFEQSMTEKSLSNGESVYLPRIIKDFSNFNIDEMKERAKNVLTSYLFSIDQMDDTKLSEGNEELIQKLKMHIYSLEDKKYEEHFDRIKVHRCVLKDYAKKDGRCVATFQLSVQYYHYIESLGKILNGRKDMLTQARYEVSLIYIQDRNIVKKSSDLALGANCPNCGAPISDSSNEVCPFCGSHLELINIYAWTFSDVKEV